MSKSKLGSGARFSALTRKLAGEPGVHDPKAMAAMMGRRKHGKKRMAEMAAKGRS